MQTIQNYGTISSKSNFAVYFVGNSDINVYNAGVLSGIFAIRSGIGNDFINNRGNIDGDISLNSGNDWLTNRGLIDGAVILGDGADIVNNQFGTITGGITFGAGIDTFIVGASTESADGGADSDTLDFSKSSGVRIALDDSIVATGWATNDSYTGFEDLIGSRKGNDLLIGDDGANAIQGLGGNDVLSGQAGVDRLLGGAGKDTLDGGEDADTLDGGAGNDILRGGAGDDDLVGGLGNDLMSGGAGSDVMRGGAGADTFAFALRDFAPQTETSGDIIDGFSSAEKDRIGLSAIDANRLVAGDQAFKFIGSATFTKAAGQLRFEAAGTVCFVDGDTNGDGKADFSLQLNGVTGLVATDFVL